MWGRLDDGWWSHPKLRRIGRGGRGLLADLISYSCDQKGSDGFIEAINLELVGASTADPDFKALRRERMLHTRGDKCPCIDKRGFEWPVHRGFLIHDFLDYTPSTEENAVAKAQRAELRDPALREAVRARDFGRCRYCAITTNPKDRRGDAGETLDHINPAIADGAENLVIACRACNSAKKKRTPEQALMVLLSVAEVRAKHYADLGQPDPDLAHDSKPTQVGQADAPGRDGTGRAGSASQVGPPTTRRDSEHPNPYLRAGHGDPALEPPPPTHPPEPAQLSRSPAPGPRTHGRRKRKANRR